MQRDFFGHAGKTPDAMGPREAYGVGIPGRQPSPATPRTSLSNSSGRVGDLAHRL
jgi:hypothetical protein